jgi:hypothetical protein
MVGNSGALSLEPFDMDSLNLQVSTMQLEKRRSRKEQKE